MHVHTRALAPPWQLHLPCLSVKTPLSTPLHTSLDHNYVEIIKNRTSIMDEELIGLALVLVLAVGAPLLIVLSIVGCVAYTRTQAWDKTRNQRSLGLEIETNRLVPSASDADCDSDLYDTDEEEERSKAKAEEEADRFITFNQKFRKEFRRVWSGKGGGEIAKKKERDDRRKLAKAVVREMARVERRKARKAEKGANEKDASPAYRKV